MTFNFEEGSEKVYVDSFWTDFHRGLQHLMLKSGNEEYVFVLPIDLAKKVSKALGQSVEVFEKQIGQKLDDRLDNDPILSPLQNPKKWLHHTHFPLL